MPPTFTFRDQHPAPGASHVRDDSPITCTITTTDALLALQIELNGELVVVTQGFTSATWARPNFVGRITYAHPNIYVTVIPRRRFSPDSTNTLKFTFSYFDGDAITTSVAEYSFTCEPRLTNIPATITPMGVLDSPIASPVLNTLRAYLADALIQRVQGPPLAVMLYDRIKRSSLAALIPSDRAYDEARANLVREDHGDLLAADTAIRDLGPFWEGSIVEARGLGVPGTTLTLLEQTMQAPYPQERVGAAAALLWLSADRL